MRRPLPTAARAATPADPLLDAKKEAVKTYIEQTKLLVTLASAFIVAPAALVTVLFQRATVSFTNSQMGLFIEAGALFVLSVLAGYVVLATISGAQHRAEFDVNRLATRRASLLQFGFYILGLSAFTWFAVSAAATQFSASAHGGFYFIGFVTIVLIALVMIAVKAPPAP